MSVYMYIDGLVGHHVVSVQNSHAEFEKNERSTGVSPCFTDWTAYGLEGNLGNQNERRATADRPSFQIDVVKKNRFKTHHNAGARKCS